LGVGALHRLTHHVDRVDAEAPREPLELAEEVRGARERAVEQGDGRAVLGAGDEEDVGLAEAGGDHPPRRRDLEARVEASRSSNSAAWRRSRFSPTWWRTVPAERPARSAIARRLAPSKPRTSNSSRAAAAFLDQWMGKAFGLR
jgi:hypothetical protein